MGMFMVFWWLVRVRKTMESTSDSEAAEKERCRDILGSLCSCVLPRGENWIILVTKDKTEEDKAFPNVPRLEADGFIIGAGTSVSNLKELTKNKKCGWLATAFKRTVQVSNYTN